MSQNKLCIYLVGKGDLLYQQGRKIAQQVYYKRWETENLIDKNDLGVVIKLNEKLVGNLNLQFKKNNERLQSEHFFEANHWGALYNEPSGIAELSAMAIELEKSQFRPLILKALILGAHKLCLAYRIKFLATVQRKEIVTILSCQGLPLIKNQKVLANLSNVPADKYWREPPFPALYYFHPFDAKIVEQCNLFFTQLSQQVQTIFVSQLETCHYESARKVS